MLQVCRIILMVLPIFSGCGASGHGHDHDADAPVTPGSNIDTLADGAGRTSPTDDSSVATGTPTGAAIGDACVDSSACPKGGSGTTMCLSETYPGGYCAVKDCAPHGHDCPGGSSCVLAPSATCLRLCQTEADCRPGYVCAEEADSAGHGSFKVCIPQ